MNNPNIRYFRLPGVSRSISVEIVPWGDVILKVERRAGQIDFAKGLHGDFINELFPNGHIPFVNAEEAVEVSQ